MSKEKKKHTKKKTSLADIANSLGVSRTLVSMVLNDRGDENGINAETQKRVIAKAKELKYKPNLLARGLRLGKTQTIGLIVADISNTFYSKIARAIEDLASQHGYRLMVSSSDEDPEKEAELIHLFRERQADGLIISTTQQNNDELIGLLEDNYPFVLIDRYLANIETNYVGVDNRQGAYEVVSHLLNVGWERIGMLTISPFHLSAIRDRVKGYQEALLAHNREFNEALVREIPFGQVREGVFRELDALRKPPYNIEAVFVANNNLAVACLEYATERGINIPEDLALVSFDDVNLFKFCSPSITAVAQPLAELGQHAIELLLTQIRNKEAPMQQVILPPELIIRQSCGAKIRKKA